MYELLKSTITLLQVIIKTTVSDSSDWSKTSVLSHWFLREECLSGDVKPNESPDFKQEKKFSSSQTITYNEFYCESKGGQGEKGKWG